MILRNLMDGAEIQFAEQLQSSGSCLIVQEMQHGWNPQRGLAEGRFSLGYPSKRTTAQSIPSIQFFLEPLRYASLLRALTKSLRNLRMRLCVKMYSVFPVLGSMTGNRWILFRIREVTASKRLKVTRGGAYQSWETRGCLYGWILSLLPERMLCPMFIRRGREAAGIHGSTPKPNKEVRYSEQEFQYCLCNV